MTDNTYDPDEILTGAETELEEVQDSIRAAANWFHEHEGKMFERREAIDRLQEHLDVREELAQRLVSNLVSDTVDPVVQATNDSGRFVGVVEYDEYDGVYTYLDYHDVFGKRKRAVCAQCVKEATVDTEVTHATENDPNGSFSGGASYEQLVTAVHNHYEQEHNVVPQDVETGASLATNTTIGGNTAYHTGNLADRGAVTITPSTSNQTIAEGYHNGNGYVEGDGNLTSGNIKNGVNIFGVNGSLDPSYNTTIDVNGSQEGSFTQQNNSTYNINVEGKKQIYGNPNSFKEAASVSTFDMTQGVEKDLVTIPNLALLESSDLVNNVVVKAKLDLGIVNGVSGKLKVDGTVVDSVDKPEDFVAELDFSTSVTANDLEGTWSLKGTVDDPEGGGTTTFDYKIGLEYQTGVSVTNVSQL